jgi:hypothetical protein
MTRISERRRRPTLDIVFTTDPKPERVVACIARLLERGEATARPSYETTAGRDVDDERAA